MPIMEFRKEVSETIKNYHELARCSSLTSAQLVKDDTAIHSVWSQRNLERGKMCRYVAYHVINEKIEKTYQLPSVDITGQQQMVVSPSGKHRAIIRECPGKNGDGSLYLEIWTDINFVQSIDLAARDLHGEIYCDEEHGSLKWSPDETKVIYVAEEKPPKMEPFYKKLNVDDEKTIVGQQYRYKQSWGEQMNSKKKSVLVVYNLKDDQFTLLKGIPEHVFPVCPTWAPDGSHIVGVGYYMKPRKLGLIYCTNRPSVIFKVDFEGNYAELSHGSRIIASTSTGDSNEELEKLYQSKSVSSPIFSPDGKTLLWLQRNAGGPHNAGAELVKVTYPLPSEPTDPTVVVGLVETKIKINDDRTFHGLYNCGFPKRCWASNNRLLFTVIQKDIQKTFVLNLDDGTLTELEHPYGNLVVLDVHNDLILVNRRNFLIPDILAMAKLPEKGQENSVVFVNLTKTEEIDLFKDITYEYIKCKHEDVEDDDVDNFTGIYVGPKSGRDKEFPLIVYPHGGPHSAFTSHLFLDLGMFLSHGYGVVLVNFRGSVGAGENSLNYLLGKIGEADIDDCYLITQKVLKMYPHLDDGRVGCVGGSHGGFIIHHLCIKYPEVYKVAVSRNPVVDLAVQAIISDIPDWAFVECGYEYNPNGEMKLEQIHKLKQMSPLPSAQYDRSAVLFQIGSKDLRVPAQPAIEYYHILKKLNRTVEMNVYDDVHSLAGIHNEVDSIINGVVFLEKHLKNIQAV